MVLAVAPLSTHSLFTHLPHFYYVFFVPVYLFIWVQRGLCFHSLERTALWRPSRVRNVIVSERTQTQRVVFCIARVLTPEGARRYSSQPNTHFNPARCAEVGQAGGRTERICIGAREKGGHCGQTTGKSRVDGRKLDR